jgi:hypothetical protein
LIRNSFDKDLRIIAFGDHLVADGCTAMDTGVVILVTVGKDKEKSFSHGNGSPALGTEKFRGVKISILFSAHISSLSGILLASSSHIAASLSLGAR